MRTLVAMSFLVLPVSLHAAVTATYSGDTLSINTDAGDAVVVTVVSGNVKINGSDPSTGPLAAVDCLNMNVYGDALSNSIDLSAVSQANGFPETGRIGIYGKGGNDVIIGSALPDTILPGTGIDTVNAGPGNDYVIWVMGDGADTLDGEGGDDVFRLDGLNVAEDLRVENAGGSVVVTDLVGGIEMPSISNFTEFFLYLSAGDDRAEIRDLAGTGVTMVSFDGWEGNDYCDASQNTLQTIFAVTYGQGDDEFVGSSHTNDWVNISGRTNDQPTNFVVSQAAGQTVVAIDNPAHEIKFSGTENLYMGGYIHDDTYSIPLLPGTDVNAISFYASDGDDTATVTASPDYTIHMDGSSHNSGDTLIVDAAGQTFTETGSGVNVTGRMGITYWNVETIRVQNAPMGDRWEIE